MYNVSRWLIVGCIIVGVLMGCGLSVEPTYPIVHARYLLLQDHELPAGWKEAPPCDAACDVAQWPGHAEQSFSRWTLPGALVQDVYAHRTSAEAEQRFTYYRGIIFQARSLPDVTYTSAAAITFRSQYAQHTAIGCGAEDEIPMCRAIVRYHNYVVELAVPLSLPPATDGMNYQEIDQVLTALDARIGRCVVTVHDPLPDPPCT